MCVVAYAAGVAVLTCAAPLVYTAAFNSSGWVPARHHVILGIQSEFRDVVTAADGVEYATKPFVVEPTSTPTPPRSFIINLFHLLTFTDTIMSSSSFPADRESSFSDSPCTRNCSSCHHHFSAKDHTHSYSPDKNFATTRSRRRPPVKQAKNESRSYPTSHRGFRLSSMEKPSPASDVSIPPGITSPLSDARNTSLLFNIGTLLEMVYTRPLYHH